MGIQCMIHQTEARGRHSSLKKISQVSFHFIRYFFHPIFFFILIMYLSSRTQLHTSYREWEIISHDREWRQKLFHTIASDDIFYFYLFLFFHNFDSPIASDTVVTRDRAHDQDTTMRISTKPQFGPSFYTALFFRAPYVSPFRDALRIFPPSSPVLSLRLLGIFRGLLLQPVSPSMHEENSLRRSGRTFPFAGSGRTSVLRF